VDSGRPLRKIVISSFHMVIERVPCQQAQPPLVGDFQFAGLEVFNKVDHFG